MIRAKADILQSINQKHQAAATSNPFEITRDELQRGNSTDETKGSDSTVDSYPNDGNDATITATISTDANSTATHQTTNSLYASPNTNTTTSTTSNGTTTGGPDQSSDVDYTMYNKTDVNDTAVIEIPNNTVEIVDIDSPNETVEIVEVEGPDDTAEIEYSTENVTSINTSDVPLTFNITDENDSSDNDNRTNCGSDDIFGLEEDVDCPDSGVVSYYVGRNAIFIGLTVAFSLQGLISSIL